jgi:hypothetical protein
MGLLQLWVAVGDEYHFQRKVNGRTADVFRSDVGWAFVVRDEATVIMEGRTASWDEAIERAQSAAEANDEMRPMYAEYMQSYQEEQAAISSRW